MSDIAIKLEHISKQYRLGTVGTGSLKADMQAWWYRMRGIEDKNLKIGQENSLADAGGDYVWALKDINLEVKKGEILGVIGKNGAGKSTLLKLLSRVTGPTTGEIKINGRIASLLEVGTGFHGELTGRENIFLNGSILGMTKNDIRRQLDEIVEFAGIAKYIDTPVKRYSSGMYVRLGFAVAAHMNPDILIVDEVLAVGDAEFQKKAIGKMKEVSSKGNRTVLFVSHNMASIRNLCQKAIVLENGSVVFSGDVNKSIDYYLHSSHRSDTEIMSVASFDEVNAPAYVKEIKFLSQNGRIEYASKSFDFEVLVHFKQETFGVFLGLIVEDDRANMLMVSSTDEVENNVFSTNCIGDVKLKFNFPSKILKPGTYYLTFSLRTKISKPFHKVERAIKFEVEDTKTYRGMKNRYRNTVMIAPEFKFELLDTTTD